MRDPDTNIGGTQIQRVTVGDAAKQVALPASFKITGALAVIRPGAGDMPEVVMGKPTFVWQDDSSEERYSIELRDARGTLIWKDDAVPKSNGGQAMAAYGGPTLMPGMIYQFRATSFRKGDVAISQTEDLRGVFQAQ